MNKQQLETPQWNAFKEAAAAAWKEREAVIAPARQHHDDRIMRARDAKVAAMAPIQALYDATVAVAYVTLNKIIVKADAVHDEALTAAWKIYQGE
jgi:hypothetical protein